MICFCIELNYESNHGQKRMTRQQKINILILTDAVTNMNVQDMVVGGRLTLKVRAKNREFSFLKVW